MSKQLNIRLSEERYGKLAALASRLGRTDSETARLLVDALVDAISPADTEHDPAGPDSVPLSEIKTWVADRATTKLTYRMMQELSMLLPLMTDLLSHGRFDDGEDE